jgi:hypothetical protein
MLSFWNLDKKDAFFQKLGFGPNLLLFHGFFFQLFSLLLTLVNARVCLDFNPSFITTLRF